MDDNTENSEKMQKLVRLVQMSKKALDDCKKQLSDKNEIIEKLRGTMKNGFEDYKKQIEDLQNKINQMKQDKRHGNMESDRNESHIPSKVYHRVNQNGVTWCLVEFFGDTEIWKCPACSFYNTNSHSRCKMCQTGKPMNDFEDDEDDEEDDINRPMEWVKEEDFVELVTGSDVELKLPQFSISPNEMEKRTKQSIELQNQLDQVNEEYRQYRVRSEMDLRQRESTIETIKNTTLDIKVHEISQKSSEHDLEEAEKKYNLIKDKNDQLKRKLQETENEKDEFENLVCEQKQIITKLRADANQWRSQYNQANKEVQKHQVSDTIQEAKEKDNFMRLEADFNEFKRKSSKMKSDYDEKIEFLERQIDLLKGGNGRPTTSPLCLAKTQEEYLKNLIIQYMSACDMDVRCHMENAIATVLKFSPEEVGIIRKKRATSGSWSMF